MDVLKELFEYQRFAGNPPVQRLIDEARGGEALDDALLDVSAAGNPASALAALQERSAYDPKRP